MAIYHLTVKTFRRSSGQSAIAAAAYRSGERIVDARRGEVHDYSRKGGVVSSELVLPEKAPQWAHNASELWNQAEQAEVRKNAVVAREFEVALPSELTEKQRRELAVSFAKELVKRHGFAAQVSIHKPGKEGDHRNHHAHILVTTRRLTERGFTEKTRELDERINRGPKEVLYWREKFAELQNHKLQEQQRPERVDHRTLKAQGIDDREATRHRGPSATAIERRTQEPSRLTQERGQQQAQLEQARIAREQAERAREQEQRQREKEQQEKAAQEKAKQLQEQAAKAREEQLANAREAAEKRRQEMEQKAATKPPEPSRTPPRVVSAWKGPSSKPASPKLPGHLEDIERRTKEPAPPAPQLRQEEPHKPQEAPPTKENTIAAMRERAAQLQQKPQETPQTAQEEAIKNREAILARAREVMEKRRQEIAQAAKVASPPKAQELTPAPAQAKPREQSPEHPPGPLKPLDVAAGVAAARERFAQMRAEQERIKAEQERAQKQKEQEQKKDRGRGGPER